MRENMRLRLTRAEDEGRMARWERVNEKREVKEQNKKKAPRWGLLSGVLHQSDMTLNAVREILGRFGAT